MWNVKFERLDYSVIQTNWWNSGRVQNDMHYRILKIYIFYHTISNDICQIIFFIFLNNTPITLFYTLLKKINMLLFYFYYLNNIILILFFDLSNETELHDFWQYISVVIFMSPSIINKQWI